jgi:exodeoxyribonuclease V alpha subunit
MSFLDCYQLLGIGHIGDFNQLPSVGAGNVLRDLIFCKGVPVVMLDKIFRQAEASDIIKASHQIIKGNTSLEYFKDDPKADIYFIRHGDIAEIEGLIVRIAQKFKAEKRLFQIITPRNTGPLGVESLNNILQEALNPHDPLNPEFQRPYMLIRKGDRVIIKKNDYENDVFNGDVGKVIEVLSNCISINIDDRIINIMNDDIEEKIKLAYSLTAHKSQGLEYPTVILLMVNQHGRNMLQRNLLYTALTRAKQKVILIGHASAIEKAINNSSVSRRNTKLGERVCLLKERKDSLPQQPLEPLDSLNVEPNKEQSLSEVIESCLTDVTGL